MEQSCIHAYTGDGKGKTTAALGLCLRAYGRGRAVLWTSFLKDYNSGEFFGTPPFTLYPGVPMPGFFPNLPPDVQQQVRDEHQTRLRALFAQAAEQNIALLVLDEVLGALSLGIVPLDLLQNLLQTRPDTLEVVLTGRDLPPELAALCDYISVITAQKHPYDTTGLTARVGIEY